MPGETDQRFRLSQQVHARRFDGETIILDLGAGKYFSLDEVGAAIWERLGNGLSVGEVAEQILVEYDVDPQTARGDVERMARELLAAGLLEKQE
jgi:hypothetical protein